MKAGGAGGSDADTPSSGASFTFPARDPGEALSEAISAYWRLRLERRVIEEKLRGLAEAISAAAVFPEGCGTGTVEDETFDVRVIRRETFKWDQQKLGEARRVLGEETFLRLFRPEWKHCSKRRVEDFFAFRPPELTACVSAALTVCTADSVEVEPK